MVQQLTQKHFATSEETYAECRFNDGEEYVIRLQHVLQMSLENVHLKQGNVEMLLQPIFYEYLDFLQELFPAISPRDCVQYVNGNQLKAFTVKDCNQPHKETKRDSSHDNNNNIVIPWNVIGGLKAGFRKASICNLNELLFHFHSMLDKQFDDNESSEAHSIAINVDSSLKPANGSELAAETVPSTTSQPKIASVIGFYSNFHSLVLTYGSYHNDQYEFGFIY